MSAFRGRTVLLSSGLLALAVLLAMGLALKRPALELWHLRKLSDQDLRARVAAADALGRMGSVRAVPHLLRLSREPRAFTRREPLEKAADQALIRIGPAGVGALREALKDPALRYNAIRHLYVLGPAARASVPDLLRCLRDEDRRVAASAAIALGRMGSQDPEVVAALMDLQARLGGKPRDRYFLLAVETVIDQLREAR